MVASAYRKSMTKREQINCLTSELKIQRTPHEPQARDVADFLLPYRLRLNLSDQNRGDRRNLRIYDSTAIEACVTLESGMTNGMTSPASRWVKFVTKHDPELSEFGPVKEWLDHASNTLMEVFSGANTYTSLPTFYGDMAGFATGAFSVEEDFDTVIHTRVFPYGSYWVGQDYRGKVNVFYREFRMTVRQLYQRFGEKAEFSAHVQNLVDRSKWEQWIDVGHIIQPNDDYAGRSPMSQGKRFYSCWFELGSSSASGHGGYQVSKEDKFLHEGGFDSFPVLIGRWKLTEGDVYGIDCPGMRSIGDIKSLQIGEKRSWQAVEKLVNPHWIAPSSLPQNDYGFLPGEVTYLDERSEMKGLRPLYEINPRIAELEGKQGQLRERIYVAFYTKLFRMLELLDDRERTATEIAERKAEKIEQLLPTYGHIERDVLRPFADRTFEMMLKQNLLPPPPEELQGQELDYEYSGIFAQAQKLAQVAPIERLVNAVVALAGAKPDIMDKIDLDQAVDEMATSLGVPARLVMSDERVAEIRAARAQQMQAQQQMAAIQQGAMAAKNLAQSPLDTDNALSALVRGAA